MAYYDLEDYNDKSYHCSGRMNLSVAEKTGEELKQTGRKASGPFWNQPTGQKNVCCRT